MAEQCIFCRIVAREAPSDIVYEDEELLAFKDISPQAPIHLLIIPKAHIGALAEVPARQEKLVGRLIITAKQLAEKQGIAKRGYRLVINCGTEGGQVIPHLHLHLIGGRKLDAKLG